LAAPDVYPTKSMPATLDSLNHRKRKLNEFGFSTVPLDRFT
jgi:hypothetical protein